MKFPSNENPKIDYRHLAVLMTCVVAKTEETYPDVESYDVFLCSYIFSIIYPNRF